MIYDAIRLKEEKLIYDGIFKDMQATEILELMKLGEIENQDLVNYRKLMGGILLKVSPNLTPDLHNLFQNVVSRLKYKKQIECYVVNDSNSNAYSLSLDSYNQPNVVVLTSQLINTYDDNEIEFAIGHEIGHLIIDEKRLGIVRNFIFHDATKETTKRKYNALKNQLKYLDNLMELSADRFGFLGCNKLEASISTLFRMYSGINIKKKFSLSQLFEDTEKKLTENLTLISKDMLKNSLASTSFLNSNHPIYPIRILAVKYFTESKLLKKITERKITEDKQLSKNIDELCEMLEDFELSNNLLPFFIASAGLVIAELDGEITSDEIDIIEEVLSKYTLFPSNVVDYVYKDKNKLKMFEETTEKIITENPILKKGMFHLIMDYALADGVLHEKEKDFIFSVGQEMFGFSKEDIAYHLAFTIKEVYVEENS